MFRIDRQIGDPHATYMRCILLAVMLLGACDISAPVRKTAALEHRIAELEEQLAAKKDSVGDSDIGFASCLGDAERAYWSYIKINRGRIVKRTPTGDAVWRASPTVWAQATADKRNAIELCKITWK